MERFSNGTSNRYVVEDDFRLKTSLQEKSSEDSSYGESHLSGTNLSWLPDAGVGVGSFSSTSAAAIRWVSKDGNGALGSLFIGGWFGYLFDGDPKQWRMYADFIGSAGRIFDLATQVYPAYFLPLTSVGNLTKSSRDLVAQLQSSMWLIAMRGQPGFK